MGELVVERSLPAVTEGLGEAEAGAGVDGLALVGAWLGAVGAVSPAVSPAQGALKEQLVRLRVAALTMPPARRDRVDFTLYVLPGE